MRGDLQLCALTDCNCGDRHFLYLGQHSPDALPLRPDVSMWRRLTERVVLSVIVLAADSGRSHFVCREHPQSTSAAWFMKRDTTYLERR